VVRVLYAGRCAEEHLASVDPSVVLPENEPNWGHDESEALRFLQAAGHVADEDAARANARDEVRRIWHIIARVAAELSKAPHGSVPIDGWLVPDGLLLREPHVAQFFRPIAEELQVAFHRDDSVLRHELGHALVWFMHGGGLGPLRLTRAGDGLLEGGVLVGPRHSAERETPDLIDAVTERILGGEIAARIHLGLCDWQISIGSPLVCLTHPAYGAARVRNLCRPELRDARNVLSLAEQHHTSDWWSWIEARLLRTREHLTRVWPQLDALADEFLPLLPAAPGTEWKLPGTDLIARIYDAGIKPFDASRRPVELVPKEDAVFGWTSMRRCWRRWGCSRTRSVRF
jgi:hypothetical protein